MPITTTMVTERPTLRMRMMITTGLPTPATRMTMATAHLMPRTRMTVTMRKRLRPASRMMATATTVPNPRFV